MAVISITISESPLQILAGVPTTVTLSTNIPATIFYTLDGSDPDTSSSIAVSAISLPTDQNTVTLKVYATNGTDESAIVTYTFGTSLADDRRPHDTVTGIDSRCRTHYPFSDQAPSPSVNGIYGNTGGVTVDDRLQPRDPYGYDGTGTDAPASYYTPPLSQYDIIYSETDAIGQMGRGIGTLPAAFVEIGDRNNNYEVTQYSETNSPLFNPKAMVIFQDSEEEPYDNVSTVMRPYFALENPGQVRDGDLLQQAASGIASTGSFVRRQYNPKDNTMTYYYYDNRVGRWIISKTSYVPGNSAVGDMSNMVLSSRKPGIGFVFEWRPFAYRTLF